MKPEQNAKTPHKISNSCEAKTPDFESLYFIKQMLGELFEMSQSSQLEMTAYLIGMAIGEIEDVEQQWSQKWQKEWLRQQAKSKKNGQKTAASFEFEDNKISHKVEAELKSSLGVLEIIENHSKSEEEKSVAYFQKLLKTSVH